MWVVVALLFLYTSTGVAVGTLPLPSPWRSADIGDVGTAGRAWVDGDGRPWFLEGAGDDIWGSSDAFQFAYAPMLADGFIVVGVESELATDPFAKAGLMLRSSLDADAADVILDVKPDGGIEFMTRSARGAETVYLGGASTPLNGTNGNQVDFGVVLLKLERRGDLVIASVAPFNGSWTTIGSTQWMTGPALAGLAVTSHDRSTLNRASFDIPGLVTLPLQWSQTDVGDVGVAGSASFTNDAFTVTGAGSDIWSSGDSFHFVYGKIEGGDLDIVARVGAPQDTNMFAKAGLMMRGPAHGVDDPGAPAVIFDVKPDGNLEFMARRGEEEDMVFLAGGSSPSGWLKLSRRGDTFTGYTSPDGQAWTAVASVDVALSTGFSYYLLGLAVTSHDMSVTTTAVFEHAKISLP